MFPASNMRYLTWQQLGEVLGMFIFSTINLVPELVISLNRMNAASHSSYPSLHTPETRTRFPSSAPGAAWPNTWKISLLLTSPCQPQGQAGQTCSTGCICMGLSALTWGFKNFSLVLNDILNPFFWSLKNSGRKCKQPPK